MQVCTQCGKESRDDETACAQCGQRFPAPAPAPAPSLAQAGSTAPTGWVWPWQRADHGDAPRTARADAVASAPTDGDDTGPTSTNVDLAARAQMNGSAPRGEPVSTATGRLILEVTDGDEPAHEFAHEFALDGRNVTIGRAPACTVSLPEDQLASRLHAMLHFTGHEYTISDLGSSNGTLVNGTLILGATPLAEGDRITVGQHVLIYTQSVGTHTSEPEDARAQAVVPASAMAQTTALTSALDDTPFDAARPDDTSVAAAATQGAWAPPDAASNAAAAGVPETAPTAHVLPAWPPVGADPWVMPAPPQWAAGPGADTWTAPREPQQEHASGTEETAAAWPGPDEYVGGAEAPGDAAPWATPPAMWNEETAVNASAAPSWLAGAAPDAPHELEASTAAPSMSASAALDLDQGPATGELAQVRSQLMQSSELLARWTQSAASHTRQLRTELAALAYEIANVLAETHGSEARSDVSLEELVQLSENAAQDPHHVNTVVALASRSGEVASALRTQRHLLASLKRVADRLTELARQDSW